MFFLFVNIEMAAGKSFWIKDFGSLNSTGVGGSTIADDICGINLLLTDFEVGINLYNYVRLPLIRIQKGIDAYRYKMKLDNKIVRRGLIDKNLYRMLNIILQDSLFNEQMWASNYCWTQKN